MENESFDAILSFSTPSNSRYPRSTSSSRFGSSAGPSQWMTEQRKKRGYGRRGTTDWSFKMELGDAADVDTTAADTTNSSSTFGRPASPTTETCPDNSDNNPTRTAERSRKTNSTSSGTKRYPRRRSFRSPSPLNAAEEVNVAKKKRRGPNHGRPPLFVKDVASISNNGSRTNNGCANSTNHAVSNSLAASTNANSSITLNNASTTSKTTHRRTRTAQTPTAKPPPVHHRDYSTPAANTRRRVLQRSLSAASQLEENLHPNGIQNDDVDKGRTKGQRSETTTNRTTRKNKKRTATMDMEEETPSPPKIACQSTISNICSTFSSSGSSSRSSAVSSSSRTSSSKSFGSTSKSLSRNGSFGSLAKSGENWGHHHTTTLENNDSVFHFSSPSEKGVQTPLVGKVDAPWIEERTTPAFRLKDAPTTPAVCLSPPSSSLFSPESLRPSEDVKSDDESMSSCANDDDDDTSSSCSLEEIPPPQPLSDQEIFTASTPNDFKFLLSYLSSWSKSLGKSKMASMGLNNGCQIAVPLKWTSKRKSAFLKWVYDSFGLKGGRAGMNLVILRCVEARGLEILGRLRRISRECSTRDVMEGCTKETRAKTGGLLSPVASAPMLDSRASSKPSSHLQAPSAFPFCDENDDDELAESFEKQVNIGKTKKVHKPSLRSISLQPLARAIRSPLPIMSRRLRLSTDSYASQLTIDSGRKPHLPPAPPRFSTESAMSGTDFLSQIHGAGPLSPMADFGSKLRQRASRMLHPKRSSLEKPRLSFESCARGGKPYESPHPNNHCIVHNTPLPRADFGCECPWETPMPKQAAEHWGSQPIVGRDWGSSCHCDNNTIKRCTRIFAQAWFKSGFNGNDAMCDSYKMAFLDEEQASLHECYNSDSEIENEEEYGDFDVSPEAPPLRKLKLRREDSVGGSALALLHLDDADESQPVRKPASRRSLELRKYRRRSLCATAYDFVHPKRCLRQSNSPSKQNSILPDASLINSTVGGGVILTNILSFFDQTELLQRASLVCTTWNDAAAEALGTLMIQSVGCVMSIMSPENDDADYDEVDTSRDESDIEQTLSTFKSSSIARSMEKDWSYFENFSTGRFLSEGAFKKVFQVWNRYNGSYEALSVMDVDAITETGNLHTVGAELAVSALLSSMARRNIAPNFVITRGVFTCQNNLPPSDWDNVCDEGEVSLDAVELKQGESGNFQFIRMELCKHADTEDYIRKLPNKMFTPLDCRNLLFQMAFALHVAGDKLGMKHYDVKLLNFFLQSALDDSTPENLHPHVVLRYGVGSSVFRLRMNPSNALIVKLADYGTSVLRSESDGQPVSIGQFTTFENTPPDYLILGNDAKQGYGHDCFGLGLSMLHLFTGHCPYEEIMKNVVCPDSLKKKLRKIWNSKTHDIICSAMMYEDSNGEEVEDETFYDTLYRFIVLFGMPEHKIKHERNSKVRRAINSTLLQDDTPDSRVFESDRRTFSLADGTNEIISNARERLKEMDGAMDLLHSLVCFDATKRATPLDVINSRFMAGLVEDNDSIHDDSDIVRSYMTYYSTK